MNLLRNTSFMLYLSLAVAFLYHEPAERLKFLIIPSLFLLMLFSLKNLKVHKFTKPTIKSAISLMSVNFILLSGISLISSFFVSDVNYKIGIIVFAAMPPAVAFIPIAALLGGNLEKSFITQLLSYLFAFIFTPLLIYLFFRESVNLLEVVKILFILIIIPFIMSRFIVRIKYDFKEFINFFYAFGFYLAIGLSVPTIFGSFAQLISLFIIFFILKFAVGYAVYKICNYKNMPKEDIPLYTVNSTFKNSNMGIGILLVLFSPATVMPLAINSIIDSFYTLFLLKLFKK